MNMYIDTTLLQFLCKSIDWVKRISKKCLDKNGC